jgi:ABC-2 type transport system permease protein
LFLTLGLLVRRALPWGLAYIVLWEGFVASAGKTASRLALRSYTRSILSWATDVPLKLANTSTGAAVIVPIAVGIAGAVIATWSLHRIEVA